MSESAAAEGYILPKWKQRQLERAMRSSCSASAITMSAVGRTDHALSNNLLIESWQWREHHELPRWGQNSADTDLASIGLSETLTFPTLVTAELKCKVCGRRDNVCMVKHHPGDCHAFEWTHGIDIDWGWTYCGKHEDFRREELCRPNGSHPETGCVEAPICIKCFKCPCASCIAARKRQFDEM